MTTEFLKGQVAVVTGGSGVLGAALSKALVQAGATVAVLGRNAEKAHQTAEALGGQAFGVQADVLDRSSLEQARKTIHDTTGPLHILVNCAGGNHPSASTSQEQSFFDLGLEGIEQVMNLNVLGTILPCQVFGRDFAAQGRGAIVNISSMASQRPLTRVVGYSAAKAAVENFTRWLAVHFAQEHTPQVRVNAIAPGFFLTEQNRYLLVEPDGAWSPRAQSIVSHTPAGRFGVPDELSSTLLWLLAPESQFITGITVPVDGGFSAFSGV
ncbi:SDR family oxidoreductase [Deinococcus cellulosilyticus]|uniref:Dioxygenase n=1 Tax=Deinococcus cellulosilyticus (strain DSM 18568 / NBRC 106333 / KACC 11606 / 5516J-15) TaxID=1223518 RepID=A0A511N0E2_DEIC1|nr:SDR family oxidoreductase [Deinococcus cellulosilyticus]GEM46324.1 dioxygenase [Deinococcus cellulosilyticus NBRC 106333 = KACC 11606]